SIMLPLAGLVMALFIGYSVEKQRVESLLKAQFGAIAFQVWYFSLRYITPVAMILLVLSLLEII
ncbi:MAG: sodium-dependent transporter, partial [Sulfurimonadaceae bacterium]